MDISNFIQQILTYLVGLLVSIGLLPPQIINNNRGNCPNGYLGTNCEIGDFNY